MSREIKFRAWNAETNKFVCWYQQGLSMLGDTGQLYLSESMDVSSKFILQQYTGMKDKDGVDIFEGDIVLVSEVRVCEVVFHEFAGCWDLKLRNVISSLSIGSISPAGYKYHTEVIGNIYSHPELLGGEK